MRIAWFSPLVRPAVLRSAYLSQQLLQSDVAWDVEIFSADQDLAAHEAKQQSSKFAVYHFHRFWQCHAAKPFELCVYHLEDVAEARFVERAMRLWPGICFFHDTELNNLAMSRFSHSTAGSDIDEFVLAACGEQAPPLGSWKIRGWSIESFLRHVKLAADVPDLALHAVVASAAAADNLKAHSQVSSTVVALPLDGLQLGRSVMRQDSLLHVGFSGISLLDDRIATKLEVLGKLIATEQNVCAEWILSAPDAMQRAQQMLNNLPAKVAKNITLHLVTETEQLVEIVASCDIWLGLNSSRCRAIDLPTMSAVALKLPVIGSTAQQWEELPTSAFLPVTLGSSEVQEVGLLLAELCRSGSLRKQCGDQSTVEHTSRKAYFAELSEVFARQLMESKKQLRDKQAQYQSAAAELQAATQECLATSFESERGEIVSSFFEGAK